MAQARNGRITIIKQAGAGPLGIATIDSRGRAHLLKRCDPGVGTDGCYSLPSVDWAPDGRRLALTATTINLPSGYNGFHILDLKTGRDRHFGRYNAFDIDWSLDGSRLAYVDGPGSPTRSARST